LAQKLVTTLIIAGDAHHYFDALQKMGIVETSESVQRVWITCLREQGTFVDTRTPDSAQYLANYIKKFTPLFSALGIFDAKYGRPCSEFSQAAFKAIPDLGGQINRYWDEKEARATRSKVSATVVSCLSDLRNLPKP
jgi:hypothetical protein